MTLSARTRTQIETLVAASELSPAVHKMIAQIVEDAVAAAAPAGKTGMAVVPADWPPNYFEQFYARYPNKKAPDRARKALDKVARCGKTRWLELITGLENYILSRDVQRGFVQHPATWLNGGCWKNQEQTTPLPVERPKSFFDVAAESYGRANETGPDQGRW
jgi:hypothetical protein